MPTYQYACTECGHSFEQFQSFSEDALSVCPECQGRLRKLYNAVGVVFKGSGFYRTDSRTTPSEGSSGSTSGTADGGSTKTDTKTDKKAETSSSGGSSSGGSSSSNGSSGSGSGSTGGSTTKSPQSSSS